MKKVNKTAARSQGRPAKRPVQGRSAKRPIQAKAKTARTSPLQKIKKDGTSVITLEYRFDKFAIIDETTGKTLPLSSEVIKYFNDKAIAPAIEAEFLSILQEALDAAERTAALPTNQATRRTKVTAPTKPKKRTRV